MFSTYIVRVSIMGVLKGNDYEFNTLPPPLDTLQIYNMCAIELTYNYNNLSGTNLVQN